MNTIGILYDLQSHVLFKRTCGTPQKPCRTRGAINKFSERSGSRMRRFLRCSVANYTVFITLTYPSDFPADGPTCKRHLKMFLQRLERWHKNHGGTDESFSAFWFLEFQQRGAPHFHIFFTRPVPYQIIARDWYEIVGSKDERHLSAGTRIETIRGGRRGICAYAGKYAAKFEQKQVPEGFGCVGRFWGVFGNRKTLAASIFIPVDKLDNPTVIRFRDVIVETLRKYRGSIKFGKPHGSCSSAYIRNEKAAADIRDVFSIFGPLLEKEGCLFTCPERHDEVDYVVSFA